MRRMTFFIYGVAAHLLFLATYAWMAGFVGNLVVPHPIDTPPTVPVEIAVAVNIGLIALFGVQHSVMARPGFKAVWTRLVPRPIERSTYVVLSCAILALLMWQWCGIDVVVWDVRDAVGRALLWGLFAAGWFLVPAASLMIDHFDLLGTRQVWLFLTRRPYTSSPFRTPMLYKRIRHPLYVGWFIAMWATPTMTIGHLLFAGALTLYIAIAVRFEERDLVDHYGDTYRDYQRRVPMFFPRPGTPHPDLSATPVHTETPAR